MRRQAVAAQIEEARDLWRASLETARRALGVDAAARPRRTTLRWGLGEAVDALAAARPSAPIGPESAPARAPEGARWVWERCETAFGARDYRLYRPASLGAARPNGLILMLHGCQQGPDGFACATGMNALAERHGLALVYPRQTARDNRAACWNWFRPGDQQRDAGEPGLLAELTRRVALEQEIPPRAIFVAGLSAGGAMAAVLGRTYPELFSAVGVHSGMPHGAARDAVGALAAMRRGPIYAADPVAQTPPTMIFHGEEDEIVTPRNADHLAADAAGPDARRDSEIREVGGRLCRRTVLTGPDGVAQVEQWMIEGVGHAWSGGDEAGGFADPMGPDASAEMVRFFLAQLG